MKSRIIISLFVLVGAWFLINNSHPEEKCVNVYVDFGSLDKTIISKCVEVSSETNALAILKSTDIKLQGTDKYGLDVVCRVNNRPDSTLETCSIMPPENAYWAFIVKRDLSPINLFPKWGWAQKGVSDVYFNPGDSLGLVFTENGKLRWPD